MATVTFEYCVIFVVQFDWGGVKKIIAWIIGVHYDYLINNG